MSYAITFTFLHQREKRTDGGKVQGLPLGIDIMYLVLADTNIQVRLGLKVFWES